MPLAGLEQSEDHVPTKGFLLKPRPHHLPVTTICRECNNGFSRDEQYAVAFLGCVLCGSTDPEAQSNPSAARALAGSAALRKAIGSSCKKEIDPSGRSRLVWTPDRDRIDRVILKNARGHAFFELGEPLMDEPEYVRSTPLEALSEDQRRTFEGWDRPPVPAPWPEVGSRLMARLATGHDLDGDWVIVQAGVYRYAVSGEGGVRVRSAVHEYLATEVLWRT